LAAQGTRFGPVISLMASNMQQYYEAMSRAAAGNVAFSKSGAALSASIKSIQANWIALTIVIAQTAIDKILESQLRRAERAAKEARMEAERMERTVKTGREDYTRELEQTYNFFLDIEKKKTVAEIAQEAIRTKNYAEGRRQLADLVYRDMISRAEREIAEVGKRIAELEKQQASDMDAINEALLSEHDARLRKIDKQYDNLIKLAREWGETEKAYALGMERMRKKRETEEDRELQHANKMVSALQKQIDLARRYAGLVTGRGTGAYSAMLGSAEAFGRVPGVPGGVRAPQSPAMNFNTYEMNRYLRIIAHAAEKELRL
jgi:hypothetical protein